MKVVHPPVRLILALAAVLVFVPALAAQDLNFETVFEFEHGAHVDTPPRIPHFTVDYPDEARNNGVEGTIKVSFVLGVDGHTRDVQIVEDLPSGAGAAVKKAVENLRFTPASYRGS